MLPSSKTSDGTNTKVPSKREQKKRINIRWNSTLFFQFGVIVSLLLTFLVLESDFDLGGPMAYDPPVDRTLEEPPVIAWQIEKPVVKPVKQKVVTPPRVFQKPASTFEPVDNDIKIVETKFTPTEVTKEPSPTIPTPVVKPPVNKRPANKLTVDLVPTFPGCESLTNNEERMACLSSKITKFIGRKFDTERYAEKYSGETHRISVQFTISSEGYIKDILARAPGKDLEKEAKKVIGKLPQMSPAKKDDQNIDVIYTIPIIYNANY